MSVIKDSRVNRRIPKSIMTLVTNNTRDRLERLFLQKLENKLSCITCVQLYLLLLLPNLESIITDYIFIATYEIFSLIIDYMSQP